MKNEYLIRSCKENEKKEIEGIWRYCFKDSDKFLEYYFSEVFKPENTVVAEVDSKILSALQLNKYTISLFDREYPVSYVVGVSTLPQSRGMGLMKHIMDEGFKSSIRNGEVLGILMPIDERLYSTYGYMNCYDILKSTVSTEALKEFRIRAEYIDVTEEISKNDGIELPYLDALVGVYERANSHRNGYVKRDSEYFRRYIKEIKSEGGYVYLSRYEGELVGYISYTISGDRMYVRDMYYTSRDGLASLLRFIYNHNTQAKYAEITLPIDCRLKDMMRNPKEVETSLGSFMMGRVLDVKSVLKDMAEYVNSKALKRGAIDLYLNDVSTDAHVLRLNISDDYIETNNLSVDLIFKRGEGLAIEEKTSDACVTSQICGNSNACETSDAIEALEVNLDIGMMAAMIFGHRSLSETLAHYGININDGSKGDNEISLIKSLSDIVFEKKINHINEYV